jgi:hypothetical protein
MPVEGAVVGEDVFLVDGVGTPQGRYAIDEVILGAANQVGEDNREGGRRGLTTLCVGSARVWPC